MRKLGLIGGLGPVATIHYYSELAKAGAGELLIVHADMELALRYVQRGDREGLARYFAGLIERLAGGGAEVAAITAVTPHICIRELEKVSALPLVSIIDAVRAEIEWRGYKRVALFGTRYVVESGMYGMLDGVELFKVPDQVEAIHSAYMQFVNGRPSDGRAVLTRIARELPVDAVVLAGTDLSPAFNESNTEFPFVDCVSAHLKAMLQA